MKSRLAIITKHQKGEIIRPIVERFGFNSHEVAIDTDTFGTFTGSIPRRDSQIQTAKQKIISVLDTIQDPYLLASEGAFYPDPNLPLIPVNREIIVLYSRSEDNWYIGEAISHETNYDGQWVNTYQELLDFAYGVEFPQSRVIISTKPQAKNNVKDALNEQELSDQWEKWKLPWRSRLWVETDMRAHANHLRPVVIRDACEDCFATWERRCPECSTRGFARMTVIPGLPCCQCQIPSSEIKAIQYQCSHCGHQEISSVPEACASVGYCHVCNP